jgi:hypothetical protein
MKLPRHQEIKRMVMSENKRCFCQPLWVVVLFFSLPLSLIGQRLQPSVLASAGGVIQLPQTGTLSWTLGEIIVEQVREERFLLTQGFQQAELTISTSYYNTDFAFAIHMYPNPASDHVVLGSDYPGLLKFILTDLSGKLIHEGSFMTHHQFPVDQIPAGHYSLTVREGTWLLRTFLLEKIH